MLSYRNIDDIRSVFLEYGAPVWSLHSGKGKQVYPTGQRANAFLIYRQDDGAMPIEHSWGILQDKLRMLVHSGGYGHIYQGEPDNYINIPVSLSNVQGGSGINGMNMGGGIYGNVYEAIAKERAIWDLERKVEELESGGRLGFLERVAENLLESGQLAPIINGFLAAVLKQPQIAATGQQAADTDETGNPNKVIEAVNRLASKFATEREFIAALNGVENLINQNPEIIKQLKQNGSGK